MCSIDTGKRVYPNFDFTVEASVESFFVPEQAYTAQHPNDEVSMHYAYLCVSAYVIDQSTPSRILLVQRAASDSMPNRWEVPGGACDIEDPTVLYSVARELWEESGLFATNIGPLVGLGHAWFTRSGRLVCKFGFLADAKKGDDGALHVQLDPLEHQSYAWATEEEVKAHKVGEVDLVFTNEEQTLAILRAFVLKRTPLVPEHQTPQSI